MTIEYYPDFFNDVFGPIMQPGSSSHTAAPCRLGYLARNLLGEPPKRVHVLLDRHGSFAGTFGLMAGAMGILPHDARIFDAQQIAERDGIDYCFEFTDVTESTHVNAMKFVLTGKSGKVVALVGDSTGGGMIETQVVNGHPLRSDSRRPGPTLSKSDPGRDLHGDPFRGPGAGWSGRSPTTARGHRRGRCGRKTAATRAALHVPGRRLRDAGRPTARRSVPRLV